uniref:non-specific serine/threonine protein kinase n=1 Tax=Amphimedon queenslandica TaxID=400682 RepID=A0A1X7V7W3_AMPQE
MSEVESKVQADSRALLPEDVTGSADMNLRKQIYRVVMGYIELPFKDDSGHDEDGVVVIDFIYKCIDQRPQSFIEGDHDVDCDFLQWLLSSCCLIMSKSSQMININLINCLTKLFQLLFLKDRKLFSYLTAGLLRVIKDIVVLSFSEHGNVQFPPVSLFTFHQKNFSSDLQAGILQLKSNVEINVILLSLLNLLHNLLENIGPFPMELDWNHLILLSKNHNHQIRNVSLKFIATSLSNGVTMPPQILDSLCWLLLDLLSHGPRTDYLQSLVSCCDLVFGTSDREILAPLRFFDQLAVALLQLTYTGIYKSSTIIFQDCVGHLLYNCWLVGVLSLSKIRYLLHYITDTNSNLKPFILLLEKALFNELAVISKCNESLKFHNIEHPHPAFKKKLKGSAPQYGQKRQNERKYSNSLIKLLCHIMFSCGQKLSQSIESQFASLANLETLSSILRLVAGCSVKHYEALKFWLERNEFAGMLELLDAVSVKFINSDTEYKVLKLVYTCLISIGCLMSQSDLFLAQKNQCLYILSNYSSKESIIHHKPSYNGADFQWITEIEEINLDLAIHALCALHYVCNGDILLEVVRKGMVTGVLALKVELIRILPLVMYELDSNEAILFLNELVNDAASYSWTESMLLQLSKHALLLCYIVTGVKITRSLEWRLSQETFFIDNSDYQHIVEANAPINNELLSSTYCKILNFIILNEEKSKHILISTLESSIKICSFINQDALFPLLSLMDHEDIEVVSSFGKHSAILFNLWGSYEGDISNHPFLRKLTLLALSCHTKRSKVSIDILGCLGRFKNNNVFRHCVILLLEMLLRGSIVIKAAAFNEIKELCRFHRLASGKLPLPLKHQICELLVEILNEKPFMILCSNLKKNFCAEISNVFGYKTVEEFLQSIHDPFISLLVAEGSNHVLQCLTFIAEKFNKTIGELLVANFHYIFSNLICKCSESRRSLSLQFLKTIMPDLDMVFVVRRSKILNQLLLQLYSAPSQVTVGITFLASVQKSPSSMSLSSDVEIADHLEPNFLSILKFFDAKLEIACEHEDHDLGLMAISSLTSLIVIMGSKYITKFRVNVMALLRLCQKFKNLEVCKKACEAWDCFIQSVSIPLLGPLLSEIVVVLTPWVSLFSNIITKIFTYLFITNKDSLCSYFDEVYVIPDHPFLKDINSVIKDSIISHNMSWECVLESHLKHLLKGINHQRSDVRSHAVQSLLLHLKKHQTQIQELVINRDIVHPAIADIITSLVCNLKDADSSLRLKCGECLGILGAIDPGRISYQTVTTVKAIVYFETDMLSEKFSIELIEHLKQVFLASRDAQEQNCCAFAIQEVLSVLNCANADAGKSSDGTHIWNKLPENTQEIFSPYLHSKYSPRYPKLENSADFFKLSHFKSYKDWIQKWAVTLIYRLHKSIAKQLFLPCTLIFKYNIRPAEFLLPHVLLAVLSQKDFGIITKIQNEICHILQHCDSIRDIPRDVAETVSLCSQTVFASLDYLQTWVHNKMKLQPTAKSKPMKSTNESGSQNISIVENFLKSIPKDLLAKAAFQCHAYTRALMYFQQFLKSCPSDIIQKNLKFLQEIFVGLNDVDGVSGAAAFRSSQPTIQEQILQYQSIGNYRDALLYYQKAIRENPGVKYYEDSLHCLMSLGEFQSALTYVKGLLAEKPELSHIFNSYYIEAAWKLGDWNSLEQSVKEARSSLVNWGSGLGKLLLAAKKKACF